jgi:serine/threonine-protein kinase
MLEGTPYQLVREIGAGGMGVVYEVEHVRLKKHYVAKVIHEQIQNEDGAHKRMEREAQVLAGLSHPNVVQVHDVGTTQDGVAYFVMEKLDGIDLRRTMKKRGVTRTRAIAIMIDVLDALDYVHRRGVVHRDIKPENIFLAEQLNGVVTKVLDFGIVHIFDGDGRVSQGRITKTGGFVGTLYYAAPEQMQGKPAGPANDVYAAGLVLFELLAGKGPFDDDPGVGLSRCFKPAPTLAETAASPRELSDVVAKALEQDPDRRPTAGALAAELRSVGAALKAALGGADEDPVRAEVDDLLRHMAPVDTSAPAPRPAAGRALTPAPSIGTDATAVPDTPMMPGAPPRPGHASQPAFEATMASASAEEPPPPARAMPSMASTLPVNARQPTMQGAGPNAPQISSPNAPPYGHSHHAHQGQTSAMQTGPSPQRISSPGGGPEHGAHAMSAPPPSPRLPPSGPGVGVPGAGPLFAMSAPPAMGPRLHDSTPGAPARRGDTSPGLYATVDEPPSLPAPVVGRTPWGVIAAVCAALTLALIVLGGALAYRQQKAASATPATTGTSTASAASAASAAAPAAVSSPVIAASASNAPGAIITTAATKPASAPAATTPRAAAPAAPPAKTGNAAAPTPRVAPKGAEKDGYVKDL